MSIKAFVFSGVLALGLSACVERNQMYVPEVQYEPQLPKSVSYFKYQQMQEPVKASKIFMRHTGTALPEGTKLGKVAVAYDPKDWVDIEKAQVVLHTDKAALEDILSLVMRQVATQSGPWDLSFEISKENKDLLLQPFSLNTETTFGEFVSYISEYLMNYRGVALKFHLFKKTRILVVTDE